jgi:hypothetical protein
MKRSQLELRFAEVTSSYPRNSRDHIAPRTLANDVGVNLRGLDAGRTCGHKRSSASGSTPG